MTIKEIYDSFLLEQKYRNNSEVTIDWYKWQLGDFFSWLCSDDPVDLSLQHFKEYGVYLRSLCKRDGGKFSGNSVNGSLRTVKAFYNFAIDSELLDDFSRQLKLPRVHKKEQLILDDDEIRRLLSCFGNSSTDLRNKFIVVLMLDCGLRCGEIPRLNVSDVNLNNKTLLVRGKGSKQRIVPFGVRCSDLLSYYVLSSRQGFLPVDCPFSLINLENAAATI